MKKNLKLENRKYIDVASLPNAEFKGVVPRDLIAGDTFEKIKRGETVATVHEVTAVETTEDGFKIVYSREV